METIALNYNANAGEGDVAFASSSMSKADQLQTLVYSSLFTDAYADTSDLPTVSDDRRGHWADTFLSGNNDSHGSLLWLLQREKTTAVVVKRARDYAERALIWLIDQGKVRSLKVSAERFDNQTIALGIEIIRPDGSEQLLTFTANL